MLKTTKTPLEVRESIVGSLEKDDALLVTAVAHWASWKVMIDINAL
jgi:hypothetical protein